MAKHARLNVGGEEFDVRVEYLCRYPGSRLSELVAVRRSTEGSSEEESKSTVAEEHFIDRDPALFPVVLGALRDRTVRKRPEGHLWIDVKAELEFYHLPWSTLLPEGAHAAIPHEELAVDFVDSTLIKRLRNLPAGACGVAVALRYLADLRAIVLIDEQVSPSNVNQVGRPVGPPQPWYEQLDLYHDATSDATNCKLEFKNDDVAGFPYFPPLSAAGRICSLYPMHLRTIEIQLLRHGFCASALDDDLEQLSHHALPTNRSAFAQGQSLEVFANIGWAKGWYVDTRSFQRTFRNCSWIQIHF